MQPRSIPWLWIAIGALVLLAPGPAGRLLIDVLGGVTLTLLLLPVLLGAAGWIGWQVLQRRLRTCQACGFTSMGGEICPACGSAYAAGGAASSTTGSGLSPDGGIAGGVEIDPRNVIIDVQATDVIPGGNRGD
ncbi:MAG: hypothetical protein ACKO7Z_05910 [Cyanobacteriota bacterium]